MFPLQSCTIIACFLAVSFGFHACSNPKTKNLKDSDLDCNLAKQRELSWKSLGPKICLATIQCWPACSGKLFRLFGTAIASSLSCSLCDGKTRSHSAVEMDECGFWIRHKTSLDNFHVPSNFHWSSSPRITTYGSKFREPFSYSGKLFWINLVLMYS